MLKLTEPTLLLDKKKCVQNIERIVEFARSKKLSFRPHFKTHQSHEIGRWFRVRGVNKITVSSLKMAEYFAADDWIDITVAFPVNVHEIGRINTLAEKIKLNLLVASIESVEILAKELLNPVEIFIEIDCGDHRTGISPNDFESIEQIINAIYRTDMMNFAGFLTHGGHSYNVRGSQAEIKKVHQKSVESILPLKAKFIDEIPGSIMSYGDTPTCSVADDFSGIDEIRPGNLVFYDVVQNVIGACSIEQIAVAVACPVVAKYPERGEFVVYGGAVHLSKDSLLYSDGSKKFGEIVNLNSAGWETLDTGAYLKSLSQEHGVVSAPAGLIQKIKIGDFVGVLPIHSCLTADLHSSYLTLEGEKIEKFRFYD